MIATACVQHIRIYVSNIRFRVREESSWEEQRTADAKDAEERAQRSDQVCAYCLLLVSKYIQQPDEEGEERGSRGTHQAGRGPS